MNILSQAFFLINYEQKQIQKIMPEGDFNVFLRKTIDDINQNDSVKLYKVRSDGTEVINNAKIILEKYNDEKDTNKDSVIESCFENIAKRLLRKEIDIQEKISQMGISVQKGSLIETLLFNPTDNEYYLLLAKVEHNIYYDDESFYMRSGYSVKNNKLWKSALIKLNFDDNNEILIQEIKVFLDYNVKYWTDSFLEIDPMNEDDRNTIQVLKGVESALNRNIKNDYPKDYTILRNAVICHLKSNTWFDYNDMMNTIFESYNPTEMEIEEYEKFKDKVRRIPSILKFDTQFSINHDLIKSKIKKIYQVNNDIELKINSGIENINDIIKAYEDEKTGERYIYIKTNNEITYNSFK